MLFLFFCMPFYSMAWGVLGHRIVGEIASRHLTPKAKAAIQKILGTESIAITSNWADFIKSDTTYNYLSPWHYINLPDGMSNAAILAYLKNDTLVNAYTKMNFLVRELKKKNLPAQKKVMYLRLLIHIAGDLHQPLHIGRAEDLGGNKIKVSWFNEPTNLHRLWDEHLIDFQQLSYTEYADMLDHANEKQKTAWQKSSLSDWLLESYHISRTVYNGVKADEKLSYRYNFDYIATVNSQLLKGGIRLAGLLNEIFK